MQIDDPRVRPLIEVLEAFKLELENNFVRLTKEQELAKLQREKKLDFAAKIEYLNSIGDGKFLDSLQSIYSLSREDVGFDVIKALLDRTTTIETEKKAYKKADDKGVLKRLEIIYNDDIPVKLSAVEKTETVDFFAKQMVESRVALQQAYLPLTDKIKGVIKLKKPGGTSVGNIKVKVNGVTKIVPKKLQDRFKFMSLRADSTEMINIKMILTNCLTYGITNKKRIAYILATANGETLFAPTMEHFKKNPGSFIYNQSVANYYYSNKDDKQSYNKTTGIFTSQIQLSDYLINYLKNANYLKVTDPKKRIFTIGDNIDIHNFSMLSNLINSMSEEEASDKWVDKVRSLSDSEVMFTEMAKLKNKSGGRIITEDLLMMADFYRYAGKGFVQTTGKANYKKTVENIKLDIPDFNIDLVKEPEKLLEAKNSCYAIVIGLKQGTYGGKINNHLQDNGQSWFEARQMVNGYESFQEFAHCGKIYYEIVFRGRG